MLLLLLGSGRDRGEGGSLRLLLLIRRGGLSARGSKGGKEERELGRRRREGPHEIYGVVESRGDGGQGLGRQEGCSAQCLHLQHDRGRGREEERVGGACVCGQLVGVAELDLGEKGRCPGKECSPGEVFAMRGRARQKCNRRGRLAKSGPAVPLANTKPEGSCLQVRKKGKEKEHVPRERRHRPSTFRPRPLFAVSPSPPPQ